MKLKLESFEKIAILVARGALAPEDVRVLLAGVSRLARLGRPWVLVDLSGAQADAEAEAMLTKGIENHPTGTELRWIGAIPGLCEFATLEDALDQLKFRELRELGVKVDLMLQKESLVALLAARDRVRALVEEQAMPLEKIEADYVSLNKMLRSAQTAIINRVLDPVLSDLPDEPRAAPESLARLTGAESRRVVPTASGVPVVATGENAGRSPYDATNLSEVIRALRVELKELSQKSAAPFIEGADRAVSLLMENEVLRARIEEIRGAWIRQFKVELILTREDFASGIEPCLAREQAAQQSQQPKQENQSATGPPGASVRKNAA